MFRKYIASLLFILVVNAGFGFSVFAQTQNKEAESLRKLKVKVAKIYSQRRGKIIVKYNDGTKFKGYLTEVKDDTFGVSDSQSGKIVSVPYSQVRKIDREIFPSAGKILIITGVILGLVVVIGVLGASD